jgi:hypothetical protein
VLLGGLGTTVEPVVVEVLVGAPMMTPDAFGAASAASRRVASRIVPTPAATSKVAAQVAPSHEATMVS